MKAETTLFRIRYKNAGEERTEFLGSRNFNWVQVRRAVAFFHMSIVNVRWYQASFDEVPELIPSESSAVYYKVKWTRVPDLLEKRKVILRGGMAYVPAAEQASIVFQEFQTLLEKALEVGVIHFGPLAVSHHVRRRQPRHSLGWMKTPA